ncbi:MAG: hypothetical protein CM15mV99_140 [Caudoviricetes sp.]|nr:MAG: hypothetical protein CM15mV99_140 [Caudoviricetes sp.]
METHKLFHLYSMLRIHLHKFKWTTIIFTGNSGVKGDTGYGFSSFQVFRLEIHNMSS